MTTDTCILECVRVGIVKSGLYKPDLQPDFSNWLLRTILTDNLCSFYKVNDDSF